MTDQFELDRRRLCKPIRRSFFFGLGAALIAPMLPKVPEMITLIGGPQLNMNMYVELPKESGHIFYVVTYPGPQRVVLIGPDKMRHDSTFN